MENKTNNNSSNMKYNKENNRGKRRNRGARDKESVDSKKIVNRLIKYIGNDKKNIVIVLIFAILSTLFTIVSPKVLGKVTTEVFNGVVRKAENINDGIDFNYILKIVLILLVLYILSAVFSYIQSYIMSGVAQRVSYRLRREISEKFNRLEVGYYDKHPKGDLISRVTNDVDTLTQSLNQSLVIMITSFITVIGVLIMMLTISVTMTLVALAILPLTMLALTYIIRKSQHYFGKQQKFLGEVNTKVEEAFSGQSVIKGFNAEKFEQLSFNKINNKLYETGWKSQFLSSTMMPLMVFIGNLGYVVLAILGGYMAMAGKIAVGDIQAFIQYMRNFTQPLTQLAQIMNLFQSTIAAASRIFEFLDEPEYDHSSEKNMDSEFEGNLEFKNVKFGYEEGETIIHDFNLKVKPGQKIAIVGPTGAGKTTLVKLLMRFYNLNSGQILLDGKDISTLDIKEYRSHFAMVLQDVWLFSGTIMENLKYGNLTATDEDVYRATKSAYVDRFIQTQKDGYDTVLTEDTRNISQGQKQLLTIARAILSNPDILILDEATSSVDTRTEELIQNAMDNLVKNRTSFIIAHRLSTIKNADLILVLNNGDIVEQGTHDELIRQEGFYYGLYNSQFDN